MKQRKCQKKEKYNFKREYDEHKLNKQKTRKTKFKKTRKKPPKRKRRTTKIIQKNTAKKTDIPTQKT